MGRMVFAVFEVTFRCALKYFHRRTLRVTGRFDTKTCDMSRLDTSLFSQGLNTRDQIRGRERLRLRVLS